MTFEWRKGLGIGQSDAYEFGRKIGFIRQETTTSQIRREEECSVHEWKDVTFWGNREEFPGDKAPQHWRKWHEDHITTVQYTTPQWEVSNPPYGGTRTVGGIREARDFDHIGEAEKWCEEYNSTSEYTEPQDQAHIIIIDGEHVGGYFTIIGVKPEGE